MIRVIDISFYANNEYTDIAMLVKQHQASLGYIDHLKEHVSIQVVKHLDYEGTEIIKNVKYSSFKSRNSFGHIPFKTIRYIKSEKPDMVIVQGLVFPIQLTWLKISLGKRVIVLAQHHGETPFQGIKKWVQKIADRFTTGYLFTSIENALQWISLDIIKGEKKCFELLEASTHFNKQDKLFNKQRLGLTGNLNFLWVGRLNAGKDPVTVINAFKIFCADNPDARLFMVYQTEELLPEIKRVIELEKGLQQQIILIGRLPNEELERWYNAADLYISTSLFEATGYALLEAMACGCIPVVTDIPSFKKVTGNGKYGFLFGPGNTNALLEQLRQAVKADRDKMAEAISSYFQQELSFRSIADSLYSICKKLTGK